MGKRPKEMLLRIIRPGGKLKESKIVDPI